jgi:hypothetical protein
LFRQTKLRSPAESQSCKTLAAIKTMLRSSLLFLILFLAQRLFAQQVKTKQALTKTESSLIENENPSQFQFGHFFKSDTLYAILLNTSQDYKKSTTYCKVRFFENVKNTWHKINEYDSLKISGVIQTRFSNYSKDTIKDYLFSAGIVGTGGNETEYLFLFDIKTKSLKLIKGFENISTTSYNAKTGTITSVGLAAGIPSFEYYKISNFHLIKVGGKDIWTDDKYGYLEKYKMEKGKKVVYYKDKKKLPFDLYEW